MNKYLLFLMPMCFFIMYALQDDDRDIILQDFNSIESKVLEDSNNTINAKQDNVNQYSILNDLREGFDYFSALAFITSNDDKSSKILKDFASSLNIDLKNTKTISQYEMQNPLPNNQDSNDKIETKKIDKKSKGYFTKLNFPQIQDSQDIDISILSPKCANSKFSLRKDNDLKIEEILNSIAKKCDFSIQYYKNKDSKLSHINTLNVDNMGLDFILEILLSDIFYDIKPHRLILKENEMLIYEINYVSSTRMAQSNTDVLFSQEQNNQSYGYGIGNYTSYGNNGYLGGYGYNNNYTFNPQNNQSLQSQNLSGYLDNLSLRNQLRNQMNYANNQFGKSGTKIYSVDEINFWADIESKLNILLDTRQGDKFMIDKGAGLVSIWTNKNKMIEVANFLNSLESKMNLQVAIDVEILSLIHYNSNNIGIDWQEIFNILNPASSNLNLAFGGSASFSVANASVNLNTIFNLLKTYGNLRSLSNPKIMALNNQPAIISVGSVLRYSQNLVFQSNNTTNTIQNTSTQYPSVFSGILLDITPSISEDSVILRINPSITKTKDPELENTSQALTSPPNLSTNQLSTLVKLKHGERVIIGGLLNNVSQNTTQAIPGLGEIKGLKNIFGKTNKLQRNEELIIIITPTIIKN